MNADRGGWSNQEIESSGHRAIGKAAESAMDVGHPMITIDCDQEKDLACSLIRVKLDKGRQCAGL
jgi:hypothetical protein